MRLPEAAGWNKQQQSSRQRHLWTMLTLAHLANMQMSGAAEEDVPQLRARLLEALQQVERLRGCSESFQNLEAAAQAAQAAGVPSKELLRSRN